MQQRSLFSFDWTKLLIWLGLILGAIAILSPLLVVLQTSLTTADGHFTLANYQQAWQQGKFLLAFANSTLVALSVTALQIITSAMAGYALARLEFRGKQAILLLIVVTLVIPFQLLVIPIFIVLKWAHLLNSYWSLILPTAANGFGIFLMRQYFVSIPVELEEAAALDGANRLQILTQIMLPLARPAIVTLFLFTFIGEWNDLFKPLVFTTRPELRTVQLALSEFQEQFTSDWSLLMAAVVIATIPVLVLFLIGQKQFIQGIGSTGIKN
ncbi:MAG: carbohydrate ABC transporter permease [Cyanobacteria bacterium P01_C01_bin.72]